MEQYADGSRLVEMRLTLSEVRGDLRFSLYVFLGGVVFDDGTTRRTYTAADFSDTGELVVRFIAAAGVKDSACHSIRSYQGGKFISKREN